MRLFAAVLVALFAGSFPAQCLGGCMAPATATSHETAVQVEAAGAHGCCPQTGGLTTGSLDCCATTKGVTSAGQPQLPAPALMAFLVAVAPSSNGWPAAALFTEPSASPPPVLRI